MHSSSTTLHMGPAHPAAHGVLRAMLCMRGEYVLGCVLSLGLLHRGTEKLLELRHPMQSTLVCATQTPWWLQAKWMEGANRGRGHSSTRTPCTREWSTRNATAFLVQHHRILLVSYSALPLWLCTQGQRSSLRVSTPYHYPHGDMPCMQRHLAPLGTLHIYCTK